MKKLVTLILAAGLVFSAANSASAVEVKVSGSMDFAMEFMGNINGANSFMDGKDYNKNGMGDMHAKHFGAVQRMRVGVQFIASENLSAYYELQVGTFTWGGPASGLSPAESQGGALGSRAANITTRMAYIDWMVPNTDVHIRMGQQMYTLPTYAIDTPVLDDTATGITVSAPIMENVGLTGYWIRALSSPRRGSGGMMAGVDGHNDNYDLFGLNAQFKYDTFAITPWIMVGALGDSAYGVNGGAGTVMGTLPVTGYFNTQDSNGVLTANWAPSNSMLWFAGIGGEYTGWDPLRLAFDFYYSATDNKHKSTERSGWYAALSAEYKTQYGTPTLKGWYASGDDSNLTNGSERPLTIAGNFNPGATIYFKGRYGIANTIDNADPGGSWGISAQWNNISWMENLSHSLRVTYFQGTNSKQVPGMINPSISPYSITPATYLTTKDSVIEVDFDSTYYIYKNLATVLELGYAFQNFDSNVWRQANVDKASFSNAWRAALNFRYTF